MDSAVEIRMTSGLKWAGRRRVGPTCLRSFVRARGVAAAPDGTGDMQAELAGAIENLYSVFGHYQPVTLRQWCACCTTRERVHLLATTPLRQIPAIEIDTYAFHAIITAGDLQDYKYFLPRLCEVIANEPLPRNDLESVLAAKVATAGFVEWPADEQAALDRFLHALWNDLLTTWPHHLRVDETLPCLAMILNSPHAALATWLRLLPDCRPARLHLAAWLAFTGGCDPARPPVAWEIAPAAWLDVIDWLQSPVVAAFMQRSFDEWNVWTVDA